MSEIVYVLDQTQEADKRLSDAMLYASLTSELGEQITSADRGWSRDFGPADLIWGDDQFRSSSARLRELRGTLEEDTVLKALDARIVPHHAVADAMSDLARRGTGAILRNMRDPVSYVRHCSPGDRFEQHASAIASQPGGDILVQPNHDLQFNRRYLIAGGEIAGHGPYLHCHENPTLLLDPGNRNLQAKDFMSPLEEGHPYWIAEMSDHVEAFLETYPLVSGVVDVGIAFRNRQDRTDYVAHIEMVEACRPGAASIMFADPVQYARKVAEHLHVIAPSLFDEGPAP